MEREELRLLLGRVRDGSLAVDAALERIGIAPTERLAFATLDLQRAVRRGFPEVVYGPGKTPEQIAEIVGRLVAVGQTVLVTRVGPEVHRVVVAAEARAVYHPAARAIVVGAGEPTRGRPGVLVVTAGTSDQAVAAEAALTAELMGCPVDRICDVGVAGLHRLLEHLETLRSAGVIVVIAGMEGALPGVVAGLTGCPVIGVPTSNGYGVATGGETALRSMLSSCAAGLTVVNIDNGFGAGYAASLIHRNMKLK